MSEEQDMMEALRLFARLLLKELDAETLETLSQPEVKAALADLAIELPCSSQLDALAVEYFEHFLQPEDSAPPIASLWLHGQYEGDVTVQLRKIAEAAGFTLDPKASCGAPIDHLGCLLLLWIECKSTDETLANLIADEYLDWAPRALHRSSQSPGFYGQVARTLLQLLEPSPTVPFGDAEV